MFHTIQFCTPFVADLQISPKQRLERLRIRPGTSFQAIVRPYVIETDVGPVEVADLVLDDGTVALAVPFKRFRFVD